MKINCIHVSLPRFDARMRSAIAVATLQSSKLSGYYPNHYPNAKVNELEERVKELEDNPTSITVDDTVTEESPNVVNSSGIWAWVTGLFTAHKSEEAAHSALSITYNDMTVQGALELMPAAQIQSDWNQNDDLLPDYIKNKPTIPIQLWAIEEITVSKVLTTADSGKYFYSTAATDITLTFPTGLTKPVVIFQKGNGVVSFVDGEGVTHSGDVKTAGQNKAIFVAPETNSHYQIIGGVA